MNRNILGLLRVALLGVALSAASAAQAQIPPPPLIKTYNVNTTADLIDDNVNDDVCHTSTSTCSLRAAIMQANHVSASGAIFNIVVPGGIYRLTRLPSVDDGEDSGDLNLTEPLAANQLVKIVSAGAARTIIDGNHSDRVLDIDRGCTVTIDGVAIRNGYVSTSAGAGIHLYVGTLSITDSVIEGNYSGLGAGGISNVVGVLNVTRSTIRSNVWA